MSTRSTVICVDSDEVQTHLYHEMHDDCFHFLITDPKGSYSAIDIVLPDWMAGALARLWTPLDEEGVTSCAYNDPRLERNKER